MENNIKYVSLQRLIGRVSNGHGGAIPVMDENLKVEALCYVDDINGYAYNLEDGYKYALFEVGKAVNQTNLSNINLGDFIATNPIEININLLTTNSKSEIKRQLKKIKLNMLKDNIISFVDKPFVKHI